MKNEIRLRTPALAVIKVHFAATICTFQLTLLCGHRDVKNTVKEQIRRIFVLMKMKGGRRSMSFSCNHEIQFNEPHDDHYPGFLNIDERIFA